MTIDTDEQHQDKWDEHTLNVHPDIIARYTRLEREKRVRDLVGLSHQIYREALETHVAPRTLAGTVALFSGGNDSTVLTHMFRSIASHTGHANTGIGIEQTREYVRATSALWNLPLIEKHPPAGSTYREIVLDQAFPGPAHHWKAYQRLKERGMRQIRKELVPFPRQQRCVFLAGRRRWESQRRASIPSVERVGSVVWVSPLVLWTKLDMTTYRLLCEKGDLPGGPVPRNEVSDLLHMSGECLCGAFAHKGELDEIGQWYPEVREQIEALEAEVLATGKFPAWRCKWGWGSDDNAIKNARKSGMSDDDIAALFARSKSGAACSSCDARSTGGDVVTAPTG